MLLFFNVPSVDFCKRKGYFCLQFVSGVHLKKVKYLVVVLRLCIKKNLQRGILYDCIPSGGQGVVADIYSA